MSTTDRATIRGTVGALASTALASIVADVQTHMPGAFHGASPVLLVLSAGSVRTMETYGELEPIVYLNLISYTLLSMPDGSWVGEDAEDRMDAIEAGIARMILDNHRHALWHTFTYAGRSRVEDVIVMDGFIYRRETIPVGLQLRSDT